MFKLGTGTHPPRVQVVQGTQPFYRPACEPCVSVRMGRWGGHLLLLLLLPCFAASTFSSTRVQVVQVVQAMHVMLVGKARCAAIVPTAGASFASLVCKALSGPGETAGQATE